MRRFLVMVALLAVGPATAQSLPSMPSLPSIGGGSSGGGSGLPNIPGLGQQQQTPDQRQAFCRRVGEAASRCGTLDVMALSTCVIRNLPAEDSMRVAQVANNARGNASSVLSECGVGTR